MLNQKQKSRTIGIWPTVQRILPALLLAAMLVLGLWVSGDGEAGLRGNELQSKAAVSAEEEDLTDWRKKVTTTETANELKPICKNIEQRNKNLPNFAVEEEGERIHVAYGRLITECQDKVKKLQAEEEAKTKKKAEQPTIPLKLTGVTLQEAVKQVKEIECPLNVANCDNDIEKIDYSTAGAKNFLLNLLGGVLKMVAIVAVLILVVAGLRLVVAHGNQEAIQAAHKHILWTLAGLAIIILSLMIVQNITEVVYESTVTKDIQAEEQAQAKICQDYEDMLATLKTDFEDSSQNSGCEKKKDFTEKPICKNVKKRYERELDPLMQEAQDAGCSISAS